MKMRRPLPPWLEDGQYRHWEIELAARLPLALSEMRWPSKPLKSFDTQPLARWGIDIMTGWRRIMELLLEKLEAEIARSQLANAIAFGSSRSKRNSGG